MPLSKSKVSEAVAASFQGSFHIKVCKKTNFYKEMLYSSYMFSERAFSLQIFL